MEKLKLSSVYGKFLEMECDTMKKKIRVLGDYDLRDMEIINDLYALFELWVKRMNNRMEIQDIRDLGIELHYVTEVDGSCIDAILAVYSSVICATLAEFRINIGC